MPHSNPLDAQPRRTHLRSMLLPLLLCFILCSSSAKAESPYTPWKHGPPTGDDYFPIAVWLQSPSRAAQYKAIGINTYVGSWRSPSPSTAASSPS
jgi:hypothetical protein